ncbi:DUF397 domain-containing protein [Streptomyces sp. NPDC057654]|uniref:DUF397 domain-containing protein n=1 Tax=Streptomyces sp. NPDC057654 TaxID=3346196 RepID=UPI0036B2C98D
MEQLRWRKSSFSEGGTEACVEVAADSSGRARLRESDAPARVVATTPDALRALLRAVKTGSVGRGAG